MPGTVKLILTCRVQSLTAIQRWLSPVQWHVTHGLTKSISKQGCGTRYKLLCQTLNGKNPVASADFPLEFLDVIACFRLCFTTPCHLQARNCEQKLAPTRLLQNSFTCSIISFAPEFVHFNRSTDGLEEHLRNERFEEWLPFPDRRTLQILLAQRMARKQYRSVPRFDTGGEFCEVLLLTM